MNKMQGAMKCARYAFAPNYYHYCGPDTKGEFGEYIKAQTVDEGLIEHLTNFEVMYPYLSAIAQANGKDVLDQKVVEAYWVGNEMLDRVSERDVYYALSEKLQLNRKIPKSEYKWLLPKIDKKARLHHSFHVLNVFTRTGHHTVEHTVETMDQCRIGWGRVIKVAKKIDNVVKLKSQRLVYVEGELRLIPDVKKAVIPSDILEQKIKTGDWVSMHWGYVCDKLTLKQARMLRKYTIHHINLANQTI